MADTYFSERELGKKPQTETEISPKIWGYLVASINQLIDNGAFGLHFPEQCPDDDGVIGSNIALFSQILTAEIPELSWPLDIDNLPPTIYIMDLLEFCHIYISKPSNGSFHAYYGKYHLHFDVDQGQQEFRDRINRIFSRNGIAFEFQKDGKIKRIIPQEFNDVLQNSSYKTGDIELDRMLEAAKTKFYSPDLQIRKESLEKLWDAWERIKTVEDPSDKKRSATKLLDLVSLEPNFRQAIEDEASELTKIGNNFMIRHTEVTKTPITSSIQVDFLFMRMFAFINMILIARGNRN
jgi:hypothetical protein